MLDVLLEQNARSVSYKVSKMQNSLILSTGEVTVWQRMVLLLRQLKATISSRQLWHLLKPGQVFYSPGRTFKYRVVGPCCRLYDRECLPYPCCSLDWRGKQPSWRRIGRRFVPDVATQRSPSYCVQLLNYPNSEFVITLHWFKLSAQQQQWWYAKRPLITAH